MWSQVSPATQPTPRQAAATTGGNVLGGVDSYTGAPAVGDFLFGGLGSSGALNDMWQWYQGSWRPAGGPNCAGGGWPSPRYGAAFAPEIGHENRTWWVLFGGEDSSGNYLNDTWVFDGRCWSGQYSQLSPPARTQATLTWDPSSGQLILFGGRGSASPAGFGDTWSWNPFQGQWSLVTGASPPARWGAAATTDTADGEVVLFGGAEGPVTLPWCSGPGPCTKPSAAPSQVDQLFSDTWVYRSGWSLESPGSSSAWPAAQWGASMEYDPNDTISSTILESTDGTTWSWQSAAWNQIPTQGNPGGATGAILMYDPSWKYLIFFGGYNGSFPAGTWTFHVPVSITGTVTDARGAPVGAGYLVSDGYFTATTDSTGSYVVAAPDYEGFSLSATARQGVSTTYAGVTTDSAHNPAGAPPIITYYTDTFGPTGWAVDTSAGPATITGTGYTYAPNPGSAGVSGASCMTATDLDLNTVTWLTYQWSAGGQSAWSFSESIPQGWTSGHPGNLFHIHIQAVDCQTGSVLGTLVDVTYIQAAAPAQPPSAPQNVIATAGSSAMTVSWTPPASAGTSPISSYQIAGYDQTGRLDMQATVAPPATYYEFTNIATGLLQYFTVVAYSSAGSGPDSQSNDAQTGKYVEHLAPSSAWVTTATSAATITFTATTTAPVPGASAICGTLTDPRTSTQTAFTYSANAWSTTLSLGQNSPEGQWTAASQLADCKSGMPIDMGGSGGYGVDNSPPVAIAVAPHDQGNCAQPCGTISAVMTDTRSGLNLVTGPVLSLVDLTPTTHITIFSQQSMRLTPWANDYIVASVRPPALLTDHTYQATLSMYDLASNARTIIYDFRVVAFALPAATVEIPPVQASSLQQTTLNGAAATIATFPNVEVSADSYAVSLSSTMHAGAGYVAQLFDPSTAVVTYSYVSGTNTLTRQVPAASLSSPQNLPLAPRPFYQTFAAFNVSQSNIHATVSRYRGLLGTVQLALPLGVSSASLSMSPTSAATRPGIFPAIVQAPGFDVLNVLGSTGIAGICLPQYELACADYSLPVQSPDPIMVTVDPTEAANLVNTNMTMQQAAYSDFTQKKATVLSVTQLGSVLPYRCVQQIDGSRFCDTVASQSGVLPSADLLCRPSLCPIGVKQPASAGYTPIDFLTYCGNPLLCSNYQVEQDPVTNDPAYRQCDAAQSGDHGTYQVNGCGGDISMTQTEQESGPVAGPPIAANSNTESTPPGCDRMDGCALIDMWLAWSHSDIWVDYDFSDQWIPHRTRAARPIQ